MAQTESLWTSDWPGTDPRPVQRCTTSQWAHVRQSTFVSVSWHHRSILIHLPSLRHNIRNYERPLKTTLLPLSLSLVPCKSVSLEIKFHIKQNRNIPNNRSHCVQQLQEIYLWLTESVIKTSIEQIMYSIFHHCLAGLQVVYERGDHQASEGK